MPALWHVRDLGHCPENGKEPLESLRLSDAWLLENITMWGIRKKREDAERSARKVLQ